MNVERYLGDRRKYMELLIIADEQEEMVEKYIDLGDMFLLFDEDELIGECIVIPMEASIYELKNIAIYSNYRGQGYGKKLVESVCDYYKYKISRMYVGTGDSPLSIPFYNSCGFRESHRVKNFFVDNYDHPIIEDGKQLKDMVYLKRDFNIGD